jgi:hypothetical protein
MEQRITIEQLSAIAENMRKKTRSEGACLKRLRMTPRGKEKEEALFLLRSNASVKYGIRRFPDGTFRLLKKT